MDEMDLDLYEAGRAEVMRKWEIGQVVFILGGGRGFQDSLMWNLKKLRVLYAEKPARKTNLTSSHLAMFVIFVRVPT